MYEIFRTVLFLSFFGSIATALLLLLKPVTAGRFPAAWHYYVYAGVLVSMVLPIYKLIPKKDVQLLPIMTIQQINHLSPEDSDTESAVSGESHLVDATGIQKAQITVRPETVAAYIWFVGTCTYLLVVLSSYIVFIIRKKRNSFRVESCPALEAAKEELGIERKIKMKTTDTIDSPMLSGVLFPVIYIPHREISEEKLRMVLLHELTHYKRKDLLIKWIAVFVNSLHWFNPFCYLLHTNLNKSCEMSCDTSVTKNMSDEERKLYMQTILYLAEQKIGDE